MKNNRADCEEMVGKEHGMLDELVGFSEELADFVFAHLHDDVNRLLLDGHKYPQIDMKMAVQQIAARQIVKDKLPEWSACRELMFPVHLSLEQASSEITARWKSRLCSGMSMVDLTGGLGVDCHYLSYGFEKTIYVERQSELCRLARHNYRVLNRPIEVVHADASDYLLQMSACDLIFIDPARRDCRGRKTVLLEDCTPDLTQIKELLLSKAKQVLVKLSPMLDLSMALRRLPETKRAYLLSVKNECKELLLVLEPGYTGEPEICAVNIQREGEQLFRFKGSEERNAVIELADGVEKYLYEPNASLMKAGPFKLLSQRFGIRKLHPNTQLYTASEQIDTFPGRVFEILKTATLNKKTAKQMLQGITQANVAVRNFPLSAQELQKRFGLKDGGEYYLFGVTTCKEKMLLLTRKRV